MPQPIDETFYVTEDGKLGDRRRAEWVWSQLQLYAGGKIRIRLSRPKRSTKANAFMWGVSYKKVHQGMIESGMTTLNAIDGRTGEVLQVPITMNAVHWYFKSKYLSGTTLEIGGQSVYVPPSTKDLDETSFHYYLESIRTDELTLALGVYIEDPEDDNWRSYSVAEAA